MADPITITVQLPEPAGHDHQALVACEFVLDQLSVHLTSPYDESPADFKRRVVDWLSRKYGGAEVEVSGGAPLSLPPGCAKAECHVVGWLPCASHDCPKRAR